MARRFIVKEKDIINNNEENFWIRGSEVKHIQVLRHNVNDEITVNDYICKILQIKKDSIMLQKIKLAPEVGVSNYFITIDLQVYKLDRTLYIALLKGEKMDLVIQKAVELGCKKIVPFFSKNVVVKLDEKSIKKKKEKFQIIANEACKQCGRTDGVEIFDFLSFNDVVKNMENYDVNFFAYENENETVHEVIDKCKLKKVKYISCIVGAEGGFSDEEADILKKLSKVKCVSLGTRILRAETAVFNIISIIMYEFEK